MPEAVKFPAFTFYIDLYLKTSAPLFSGGSSLFL